MHAKRVFTLLLLLTAVLEVGCYYGHVTAGQARLLLQRQPVERLRKDPATEPTLRERLARVERVRAYAAQLGLRVDGQYTSFVDAPGRGIVTTVVATRPGTVEPAGFWFPVLGRLPYKGFFDPERAEREARGLRARGLDVCVSPIAAYSTLGWFDDPLTGPMLRMDDLRLVETVLHELTHATIYVHDEPEFNEGLASFVGQEAMVRFVAAEAGKNPVAADDGADAAAAARRQVEDDRTIARALSRFRAAVAALYDREPPSARRDAARAAIEQETRAALAALPLTSRDAAQVAGHARLNDACQALARAYDDDLDAWARRLALHGGDLRALLADAQQAADDDDPRAIVSAW